METNQPILPGRDRPSWWWLATVLAAGLILGIGGLYLFRMLARPLALILLAISIATAVDPVVDWLGKRVPRPLAALLVYLTLLVVLFGTIGMTIPLLIAQTRGLIEQLSSWLPVVTGWMDQFGIDLSNVVNSVLSSAGALGSSVLQLPVTLLSSLVDIVLILFLSLYWLFGMPSMKTFFLSFFPTEGRPFVGRVVANVGQAMGGYLRGSALMGLVIAVVTYIGLLVIGVPYPFVLAVIAGVLEFFPTVGPLIAGALATLVALSVSPNTALITVIFAAVLQQLENHLLVPWVMRSQTNISPLMAIFSIVAGGAVGGLLGAVVAIPLVAALSVVVKMVIAPAIRRANGVRAEEVQRLEEVTPPEDTLPPADVDLSGTS